MVEGGDYLCYYQEWVIGGQCVQYIVEDEQVYQFYQCLFVWLFGGEDGEDGCIGGYVQGIV